MNENNYTLIITDSAARRISFLATQEDKDNAKLRISVDGGGCSGFQYKYEFVTETTAEDEIINKGDAKIVIDLISKSFLQGCTLDFVEGLGTSYFEIRNPNATAKCGCGNSFSL